MRIKSSVACLTLFTAAAVATPVAMAQGAGERDNSGFFISGSYGGYKAHGGEFDDDRDLYGVSAGYQFNPFFALEADYIDFGKFGDDEVRSDLKGLSLSAKGRLPLTEAFGIYGKVGAFASDMEVSAFDEDETYDEVSPFVGAGVDFMMTHSLTAFAEYNRYNVDIDEDDFNGQVTNDGPEFDTARVGLRYTF
ncbi:MULTISPECIES: outer membrane beta-barrel protein [Marinobacter]|uniref:Opacity protein n=1 Tax=Marinobacter segnicrescens TaxID=430453 RepID=A0A1I0C8Y9_9GAMM|nr:MULTISPECIES: outer membrane beta-barrel protein [Marinobacter]UZD64863.1 outer membrane beta-barrel protein [Marinobacter sp. AN1]SET15865.1 Opacity protein [Marinobacter segnicrescens]